MVGERLLGCADAGFAFGEGNFLIPTDDVGDLGALFVDKNENNPLPALLLATLLIPLPLGFVDDAAACFLICSCFVDFACSFFFAAAAATISFFF